MATTMSRAPGDPQNRDAAGRFVAGNRANPGGRTRGVASLVRSQTSDGRDIVAFMVRVMQGRPYAYPELPPGPHKGIPFVPSPEERLSAAQWLADRAWGKAPQVVEATIDSIVAHTELLSATLAEEDVDRLTRALLGPGEVVE